MNNIFKNNFSFYLKVFLGFALTSYILYRRVLVIRLPKDLFFIENEFINYRALFICISSIILLCVIIYINITILLNKEPSDNLITYYFKRLTELIDSALETAYGFFANSIPNIYDKVSYFAQKFYKYFQNISETFFLFLLYGIRLIILSCFLLDVFVFFRLDYMYKSLYLLIFSLIIKVVFFILKDFASNLPTFDSVLIIKDCRKDEETDLPIT